MKKNVSLDDIAKKLNLSKTTVSWVLSNQGDKKGVGSATQKKVRECAAELNYQPNYLARSLNTGTTKTIGLILPSISDAFYSSVARSIVLEAEKYDYTVMICSSESEIEREEKMIRSFKMKYVDGIILAPTKHSRIEIDKLIKESYPFVLFDRYFENLDTNYVVIENEQSSYTLVKHLINKGKRKIAIITTNPHLKIMDLRHKGYQRAYNESGITINSHLYGVVPFANYEQILYDVLDKIFKEVPDVDGFFFTTHILALEAFNYFYDRGIDIKKGEGCASIHSTHSFKVLAPKMSIAIMPTNKIGINATKIILDDIKRKENKDKTLKKLSLPCDIYLH